MKKILLLSLFLVAIACGKQVKQGDGLTIPLPYGKENIPPFEESDFDYSFEIIPLKLDTSNADTFIKSAFRIVHYKGRFYFPGYNEPIQIFDEKGNFINVIATGKGPSEIMHLNDLYIDKENDLLEVSMHNKVSKFTLDGDYLTTERLQLCKGDTYKSNDYYYLYSDYISQEDSCFLNILNHKTGKVVFSAVPKPKDDYGSGFTPYNRFVEYKDSVYFIIPYHNEIYAIAKGDSIAHKYAKIENTVNYNECPDLNPWAVREYAKTNSKYYMHNSWSYSNDYIAFTAESGVDVIDNRVHSIEQRVLYDRKQNKVYKYPITSIGIAYTDQEYDYATVDPAELDAKRGSFTATEKPLMDKLCELIDQNGIDTNPYVVKIKIFKK